MLQLNMAVLPRFQFMPVDWSSTDRESLRRQLFADSTMLQCNLANATYSTVFDFVEGI